MIPNKTKCRKENYCKLEASLSFKKGWDEWMNFNLIKHDKMWSFGLLGHIKWLYPLPLSLPNPNPQSCSVVLIIHTWLKHSILTNSNVLSSWHNIGIWVSRRCWWTVILDIPSTITSWRRNVGWLHMIIRWARSTVTIVWVHSHLLHPLCYNLFLTISTINLGWSSIARSGLWHITLRQNSCSCENRTKEDIFNYKVKSILH